MGKLFYYSDQIIEENKRIDFELIKRTEKNQIKLGYIPSCGDKNRKYFNKQIDYYSQYNIKDFMFFDLDSEFDRELVEELIDMRYYTHFRWRFLLIIFVIIIIISGCSKNVEIGNEQNMHSDLLEKIKIEVVNESILPGGISYAFKLKNESEQVIVQNNVYVSLPITYIEKSKFVMNKCKVEASGNRVNIKPGEEIYLAAFIPKENYEDNIFICAEKPQLEIKGYCNELDENNHFEMSGDISFFDNNFKSRYEKRIEISFEIEQKLTIICTPSISSNPYDYIEEHKEEYNHILAYGNIALEFMLERLENSKEDGLKEYIMAIACSEILEEESDNKNWSTGLEWYREYKKDEGKKK